MTTATENTINSVIREHVAELNGTLDTREVAKSVLAELSTEQAHELAIGGLQQRVRTVTTLMRPPVKVSHSAPSARWDNVKEARDILDDFWVSFNMQRPGKRLLDCNVIDLEEVAQDYDYRAETNQVRAGEFRKLAAKLKKAKAEVVADLDRDEVRRIFNA